MVICVLEPPKIEALHKLISLLHTHYPTLPVNEFKPLDTSAIDYNARLSGMWDADGGFGITIREAYDYIVRESKFIYKFSRSVRNFRYLQVNILIIDIGWKSIRCNFVKNIQL